jgi:hypothetical protein
MKASVLWLLAASSSRYGVSALTVPRGVRETPPGPGPAPGIAGDARKTIYDSQDFAAFVRAGRAGTWLAAKYNNTPITEADLEDPFFLMFPWTE